VSHGYAVAMADEPEPLPPTAHARIPDHVVYRAFATETVILNLETGKYHGLNPTGGRMLDLLSQDRTVADASRRLAEEYGRPVEEIERDLSDFCVQLADRGLIELLPNGRSRS
jgi:Coenzyme PQQ synthesis protein D (PqqD)